MMTTVWSKAKAYVLFHLVCAALVGGCSSDQNPSLTGNETGGSTLAPGTPDNPTSPNPSTTPNGSSMTIGVKYVALRSAASDAASPSQGEVETLLANMSSLWAQCDISFKLDEYVAPLASDQGLDYTPPSHTELDRIRAAFDNGNSVLMVKTGAWDRSGDLGSDGSNGFSTIPPTSIEGTVFETRVQTSSLLLSHEIGHLIGGLGHTTTSTNLMNHFVTTSTKLLTTSQCDSARATMKQYHSSWIR